MEQSLESVSLFSLEVVVDHITLNNTLTCRFPAVAFRLLDFPTLLIYHVEPDLAERIKTKIAADPHYKVPNQLHDMKDRDGKYVVKKGKSCLFKVAPNGLLSQLMTTPLYVMLLDTYPELPKLLGSCIIALDQTMDAIYDDICKLGISTPSVHGEKHECTVFNLMGIEIGKMIVGYRLLSLGIGLLSHIPDKEIAKMTSDVKVSEKVDKVKENKIDKVIRQVNIGTSDKVIQVAIEAKNQVKPIKQFEAIMTQTEEIKKVKQIHEKKHLSLQIPKETGEFFVTNAVCPPPLFFNSDAEPQGVSAITELSTKYGQLRKYSQQPVEDDESDNDKIRPEDKFSDSDYEDNFVADKENIIVQKFQNQNGEKYQAQGGIDIRQALSKFPVLNALMSEIMSIQGNQMDGIQQPVNKSVLEDNKPMTPTPRSIPKSKIQGTIKETHHEFLERLSSPKYKSVHKDCVTDSSVSHKNKGWIRKDSVASVKKTKLSYGMTNTQRLRLAKGNQELLKEFEEEELERMKRRKAEQFKKYPWLKVKGKVDNTSFGDITTEISKHTDVDKSLKAPPATKTKMGNDSKLQSEKYKKPVPTPRKTVVASMKETSLNLLEDQKAPNQSDAKYHSTPIRGDIKSPRDNLLKQEADLSSSSTYHTGHSQRSVVHIPTASLHSSVTDSEATSLADDSGSSEYDADKYHSSYVPSFRNESAGSKSFVNYSDDFEDIAPISSTGKAPLLQQIVEQYSDDGSPQGNIVVGQEPELRKIIDQYSDDSSRDSPRSNGFHSAHSNVSNKSATSFKLNLSNMPNPNSSKLSPIVATKNPTMPTRQPVGGLSSTIKDDRNTASESPRHGANLSVSGEYSPRKPKPSPRHTLRKQNTEKGLVVLSDDDLEISSPRSQKSPGPEYSDEFDETDADTSNGYVPFGRIQDIKITPEAKLGYTWG